MNMKLKRLLKEGSPHYHPYRWLVINCTILLWSFILLMRILVTVDNHSENDKTRIEFNYLLYNFLTCIVWFVEVSFNVLDWKGYFESGEGVHEESLLRQVPKIERTKRGVVALWIEFGLAAYFFIDATTVAHHLSRHQIHRQAKGMTYDICLNLLAYSYMVYLQFVDWQESRSDGEPMENSATEAVRSEGIV
eukprot:CAMPEP_0183702706 /NCGR_PEP_ID=MMETSP0737-20130205/725_1 /TAXON_ID=385413 /ORGANISM="Thalassiosira miniscula, Strain CCMP1093" /LENGTH=191 /DNA_ID=CAMNT_0025929361 /DNA_START=266 /DNA_END=841 /DNA_ORIENTATION=+